MTEREREHVETPERTHDQPAEGGREQGEQAAEHSPASGPEGIDSTSDGLEDRFPRGTEPTN